ncbi:retrotransposon protein, putative, ty1-copia subclass [Tanacetum coccineum]
MHNMGKTIGELHAMLIEYEKGLPKKAETPQVMMIKGGKIQKANKKSLKAKGNGKANGKGKDKQVYIPKPKNPKLSAKEHPAKDDTCHHCKEVGHWKRNCPVYLAELLKEKKQVSSASSLEARKLKQGALYLYVGNGVRAQVEAIRSYDLVLPNVLVICLDNCHYAPLLGIIHTDVCGPLRHVSRQGASYFITLRDDYSRYGYVYLLKHKHEVFETLKVFKNEVENQLGKTIKALRSDRRDRSKRLIKLGQTAYIDMILKRYKMDNSKHGHILMQETLDLNKTQGTSTPKERDCNSILKYLRNTKDMSWFIVESESELRSAIEAEYIVASKAVMEAVWIRVLFHGLGIIGARHYHRRYHYVRESIALGEIRFLKVHTDDNLIDPFMKALSKGKLTQHARSMGLRLTSSFM